MYEILSRHDRHLVEYLRGCFILREGKQMKISELETREPGLLQFPVTVHISEIDNLAGKIINFIHDEMPELTPSEAVEVMSVAMWWVQLAAYTHFSAQVKIDQDHTENSYWKQAGQQQAFDNGRQVQTSIDGSGEGE
jgi:hypothetical protein